jgi:hypothetical protein
MPVVEIESADLFAFRDAVAVMPKSMPRAVPRHGVQ